MKIYTVGQVSHYLLNLVDNDYLLQRICIKGEISNCKYHSMGHIYFSLKDENSSMSCVMFKGSRPTGLDFKLEDGQAVVIEGAVKIYEKESKVNLYARKIRRDQDGEGKLHVLYEQLKQKLFDEGLFDFEKKKPIPAFPKKVGIVTASTGAAIQDICNVAHRRNPFVELILYPAKVQGEGAAATIAAGIRKLDSMGLDTIIVGRGGGSIEDLWAFNEENVARAIFEAKTPVISGTGHETDNTIADYVADLRAPTPSAAAELAIPDIMVSFRKMKDMERTLRSQMENRIRVLKMKTESYRAWLEKRGPEAKLRNQQMQLAHLSDRLEQGIRLKLERSRQKLEMLSGRMKGLSPTARLTGGFGYITKEDQAVRSAADLKPGDRFTVILHDGRISANVEAATQEETNV